ncbi:MAG: hypothetical protein ACKVY0_25790, partial [Prosthecobacter sp.]|uniref:hypothetical protein n=1 Tax=Prosthecobacter sp. TaxID=1965333 RepID=UPI0038FF246C
MIRRLIAKRAIRILLWLFITLVTFIVLLFVWTNWSGKRRWAAAKAMIEREGETLEFLKLLPATPPAESNLLAIEALRGITETVDNDDEKGEPGLKRKALAAMKWDAKGAKLPATNGVTLAQAADMAQWAKFLREVKFLDLPADAAAPGRDVLHALDAKFPLLKELADEAPKRTQAMFTPGLRERKLPGLLFALRIPHYTAAQSLARMLSLRARAAIEAKDSGEAARSLLAASRISLACESEPLLIGFLVGITAQTMVTETLWLGLRERVFAAEDLRLLQEVLSGAGTDKALLQSMRGEMAAGLGSLEFHQDTIAGRKQGGEDAANAFAAM